MKLDDDALKVEELGERVFRVDMVGPDKPWPDDRPPTPAMGLMEIDRQYLVKRREPGPRPATALRSLGALVRAWERGDLVPR